MRGSLRPPLMLVAAGLLGLIALLATLQYRWVGQISQAERERMRATSSARATDFAQDFDRELTRAYLLFQAEPSARGQDPAAPIAERCDRWQASARFPGLVKDVYVVAADDRGSRFLQRFDPSTRRLVRVEWPAEMSDWRERFAELPGPAANHGEVVIRRMTSPIWPAVPALVIPLPMLVLPQDLENPRVRLTSLTYVVLRVDVDYARREVLPALADRHFKATSDGFDYQVAVVTRDASSRVVFQSTPEFAPRANESADAAADLFQVRSQDAAALASEIRQVTAYAALRPSASSPRGAGGSAPPGGSPAGREARPLSIFVQSGSLRGLREETTSVTRISAPPAAQWRVVLKHPSGSLEAAVNAARRRNLLISSSILAVLGASMALLVLSTRRAQELARRQMEFVAGVTHELRTPLAVIRSAGDNLAEGVVEDDDQIRKYGELVRGEGRRLTEMVEQILDFAGIESGQRRMTFQPVAIGALLRTVVSSAAALTENAGFAVETDVPESLPPVLGDGPALQRVFHNLVGNAVKYGAAGRWVGIRARVAGTQLEIAVEDRGMGIAPSEQSRIFEPFYRTADVIEAQIQGAGLGLSLVKRIVEAHGGRVTVRSAPGAGSTFVVHLPLARPSRDERAEEGSPVPAPDPHHT